ncbi:MAG TPA: amidase [Acidimicrobiales bacterium]|nr:amidase [Acidimicrobiales bacterium]
MGTNRTDTEEPPQPPLSGASLTRRTVIAAGVAGVAGWQLLERPARAATAVRPVAASSRATTPATAVPAALPHPAAVYSGSADPADLGVLEAASLLRAGKLSSQELTAACQRRIAARNGPVTFGGSPTTINAWIRLYPDLAHQLAVAADDRLARARKSGVPAPALCGVPLALKDLYAVKGLPLTASSHVLDGNIAAGDSTVWAKLKAAGMVLLGHTHTHEFALGLLTPQTGNPWNLANSVGGSSGGSAAALAARMVPAATGTDTGGSLRSPPSATGVCGLKPTFGLVSAHGVVPIGWSIDHAGPMARSAGDLGLLLSALAGPDPADPATLAGPPPAVYPTLPRTGSRPLAGVRLGVPGTATSGLPAAVAALFERALGELRSLGAVLVPFTEPDQSSVGFTLDSLGALGVEAGVYHSQFFPARAPYYGTSLGPLVAALVAAADTLPAGAYVQTQQQRLQYMHAWNAAFASHSLDAVLKPGATVDGAPRTGTAGAEPAVTGDFSWADVAGLPVVALTIGRSPATGMPFGIQIGGAPHTEARILQVAIDYQAHFPYHQAAPPGLP